MISCGPVGTSPSSWPSPWTCCCPPKPRPRPVDWTWVDMRLRWNKVTVKKPHSLPVVSEESQAGVPLPSLAERIDGICSANIFVQRGNLNIQMFAFTISQKRIWTIWNWDWRWHLNLRPPHLAGHQKHRLGGLHQAFHGLELVNAGHCKKFTEER